MSNYGGGYGQDNNSYGGGYGGGNRYGGNPYAQQETNPYDQRGNQYGQQGGNQYGQQGGNRYAQQPNPYAQQQENPYAQQGNYGGAQQGGYAAGEDIQMEQINGAPQRQQRSILQECQDIQRGIDSINKNLNQLRNIHNDSIGSTDTSPNSPRNRQLDALNTETMTLYRNFTERVKKIKSTPGAGDSTNAGQVGLVERKLKEAIQEYQQIEAAYRKEITERMVRNYQTINRDADEAEARAAVGDGTNMQIFSQALMQSDRRGQSQSTLRDVQNRHQEIQKIERQVIELAQLFEDMNALVVQQEPTVARIEEQSGGVLTDVQNANQQLDGAVDKARAARKKKWICLGIVVAILIVIAIVLAIVFTVVVRPGGGGNNGNGNGS